MYGVMQDPRVYLVLMANKAHKVSKDHQGPQEHRVNEATKDNAAHPDRQGPSDPQDRQANADCEEKAGCAVNRANEDPLDQLVWKLFNFAFK